MKEKNKDFEIEELVLRVFLKHIKANNLYTPFRLSVNHIKGNRDLFHVIIPMAGDNTYQRSLSQLSKIGGSAFASSSSIEDMTHALRVLTHGRKLKIANDANFQMAIMSMVNILIHNCVEYVLTKDMSRIEKLGSSIFEECCRKLLGDDFKDMTEDALDEKQKTFIKKMEEIRGIQPSTLQSQDFWRQIEDFKMTMEREYTINTFRNEGEWTIEWNRDLNW